MLTVSVVYFACINSTKSNLYGRAMHFHKYIKGKMMCYEKNSVIGGCAHNAIL